MHGFPDDLHSFDAQLPLLCNAGFRVLAPMLRGYEPSSIVPEQRYDRLTLAADVIGLMNVLELGLVHLVGHDWGAVVAYTVAALHGERLSSLTTLAIPPIAGLEYAIRKVPGQLKNSSYMHLFQIKGFAEWLVRRNRMAFLESLWRKWSPGWTYSEANLERVKSTLSAPGVLTAALSYYRHTYAMRLFEADMEREVNCRPITVRSLLLTGALDGCMRTELYEHALEKAHFSAGVELVRVKGAGHFLHQELPSVVGDTLLSFLQKAG